jgi:hypothetical protein
MPYLSTSGQLEESWTFKSWGVKTYVFESWTFNCSDLLKLRLVLVEELVMHTLSLDEDLTATCII